MANIGCSPLIPLFWKEDGSAGCIDLRKVHQLELLDPDVLKGILGDNPSQAQSFAASTLMHAIRHKKLPVWNEPDEDEACEGANTSHVQFACVEHLSHQHPLERGHSSCGYGLKARPRSQSQVITATTRAGVFGWGDRDPAGNCVDIFRDYLWGYPTHEAIMVAMREMRLGFCPEWRQPIGDVVNYYNAHGVRLFSRLMPCRVIIGEHCRKETAVRDNISCIPPARAVAYVDLLARLDLDAGDACDADLPDDLPDLVDEDVEKPTCPIWWMRTSPILYHWHS
jgi:hypothetical protein